MAEAPQAWKGWRRQHTDLRDKKLALPKKRVLPWVDVRHTVPPVMDQGPHSSCTAHGVSGLLRNVLIVHGKPDVPLARLQLWYDTRATEGSVQVDTGCAIRDAIKCAAKFGVAPEKLWPYKPIQFRTKPPASVYKAALNFQAVTYEAVKQTENAIKAALTEGLPIVFGFDTFESFDGPDVEKTGMVPMPGTKEESTGGHCVYMVGYGLKGKNTVTCRNSYGTDWGDHGDFHMPLDYVLDPVLASDFWIIRTVG